LTAFLPLKKRAKWTPKSSLPRSSKTPKRASSLKSSGGLAMEIGAALRRKDRFDRLASVEAVLFDLDGTLIDTLELICASLRYATEQVLGESPTDDELMRNVGIPLIAQLREFDADRAEEMVEAYRQHNRSVHDEMIKEYPGVEAALASLAASGYRLGVVTSKIHNMAQRGLECFGIDGYFELIVGFDDVEIHKPDPHPLIVAADRLGVAIERCAYVGDSPHDMAAAIAAGCVSVAAVWGVASQERVEEPGPDFVVESMAEVAALFEGTSRGSEAGT
jgi:pyrophosphatase PpaX